jgi:hypothetical protein
MEATGLCDFNGAVVTAWRLIPAKRYEFILFTKKLSVDSGRYQLGKGRACAQSRMASFSAPRLLSWQEFTFVYRPRRPLEELAVDLLFAALGEHRYNRSAQKYAHLRSIIPPLKQAHYLVNQQLKKLNETGMEWYEIWYYKPGDLAPVCKPFPTSISLPTVRNGLGTIGFRDPQPRNRV